MIVVDSSVWIAHFRGIACDEVEKLEEIVGSGEVLVGDLVLLELLQGARDDPHADVIERYLRQFDLCPISDIELAVAAASNYRTLRGMGVTIRKTVDLIIGTFCLRGDHLLLQKDRDFAPMVEHLGLKLL